ncbi:bromodomain-containing protein 7 [Striga asiatica]|uniref:Bromodomain-containing protein 7 n=1 Tax=Striga asiatica TaxID=4170 RepID=A0A5A7PSC1_STRAF|nr:bromodomain-containing protein 7 [Striga asiatica]
MIDSRSRGGKASVHNRQFVLMFTIVSLPFHLLGFWVRVVSPYMDQNAIGLADSAQQLQWTKSHRTTNSSSFEWKVYKGEQKLNAQKPPSQSEKKPHKTSLTNQITWVSKAQMGKASKKIMPSVVPEASGSSDMLLQQITTDCKTNCHPNPVISHRVGKKIGRNHKQKDQRPRHLQPVYNQSNKDKNCHTPKKVEQDMGKTEENNQTKLKQQISQLFFLNGGNRDGENSHGGKGGHPSEKGSADGAAAELGGVADELFSGELQFVEIRIQQRRSFLVCFHGQIIDPPHFPFLFRELGKRKVGRFLRVRGRTQNSYKEKLTIGITQKSYEENLTINSIDDHRLKKYTIDATSPN